MPEKTESAWVRQRQAMPILAVYVCTPGSLHRQVTFQGYYTKGSCEAQQLAFARVPHGQW